MVITSAHIHLKLVKLIDSDFSKVNTHTEEKYSLLKFGCYRRLDVSNLYSIQHIPTHH